MQTSYTCHRSDYLVRCTVTRQRWQAQRAGPQHRRTQNEHTDPWTVTLLPKQPETLELWLMISWISQTTLLKLLVQALVLSRLDYCNALLAGLPASSIKPLQLIQNAAARLIFNEPKTTHVIPLFINSHWLPIAACIKFKALMFAYRSTSGSAPLYLNSLLQSYMPSRV